MMPPLRCAARTSGFLESAGGGLTFLSDLSVSMPGEVARRAARECLDVAAGGIPVSFGGDGKGC